MAREYLTDEEVELEIERLTHSEEVKLARLEQRLKYAKRQHLYTLRHWAKRGKKLMEQGMTADILKAQAHCLEEDM